jgi:hypothetical protein
MTQPTEKRKPEQLTTRMKIDNMFFNAGVFVSSVVATIWTVQMWLRSYARWHKKRPSQRFKPMMPKIIEAWLIGKDPQTPSMDWLLKSYHVRTYRYFYQWRVNEGYVGLTVQLLVNPSMFDKVDSILHNNSGGFWIVESSPGTLRDVQFRPHAVADQERQQQARRPPQPTKRPAKAQLGKTWR